MYEENIRHPKKEDYNHGRRRRKKHDKSKIPDNENIKEAIKENKKKKMILGFTALKKLKNL